MRLFHAALFFTAIGFTASAQVARLQHRPDLAQDLQGLPRVVANADVPEAIAAKINASLSRFDAEVKSDERECLRGKGERDYQRQVAVTMTGPRYLSMTMDDTYDCGGPHPDDSQTVLTYDLKTGSPVNWEALLPPEAKGETIRSKGRLTIALMHWPAMLERAKKQASGDQEECGDAYVGRGDISLNVYLSAEDHAIALQPNLTPHFYSATCSTVVLIRADEAKRLGIAQPLIDAITNAK